MINWSARLVLAVMFVLSPGVVCAGEEWFDQDASVNASSLSGSDSVRIQPSTTHAGAIVVNVNAGSGTVTGGLTISGYNAGDSTAAPVRVDMSMTGGSSLTFGGALSMIATETSVISISVTGGSSLEFTGLGNLTAVSSAGVSSGSNLNLSVEGAGSKVTFGALTVNDQTFNSSGTTKTISITNDAELKVNGALTLYNGGITVNDATLETGTFVMGGGSAVRSNAVRVEDYGTFRVLNTGSEAQIMNGSFYISNNATDVSFLGGVKVGKEGSLSVGIGLNVGTKGVTIADGGSVTVASTGEIVGSYFDITGGSLQTDAGSLIGGSTRFTVSGTSSVSLAGQMLDTTTMELSGGTTTFASSFTVVDSSYTASALTGLAIKGSAIVNVASAVDIRSGGTFEFTGGTVNLQTGGALNAASTGNDLSLRGTFNLNGGTASFADNVSWTGGKINVNVANAAIDMNNNKFTLGAGGTLDASEGNLTLSNSTGLTISGTYMAGYNGSDVTMVTSTGGSGTLTVNSQASIQMSSALQRYINSGGLTSSGGEVLILDSDALTRSGAQTLSWVAGSYVYDYEVRQKSDGTWGLFVTNSTLRSSEEQYNALLNAWNSVTDGNAAKLINRDFANVIIQSGNIVTGSGNYDALSKSGKFNAEVLSSLSSPSTGSYDALMLYNGSGLGMVNQAVINSNYQIMKVLGQRNKHLRHELQVASDSLSSSYAYAADILNETAANRVWAVGNYIHDNAGEDEGYMGYHYRATGVAFGYDRLFGNMTLGGAFSYTGGDFEDSSALENDSTINTYGFHLYGSYNSPTGWFANGSIGYGYSDDQIRDYRNLNGNLGWNTADYHTNSWMMAANVGYDLKPSDYLTVSASMGIAYQHAANSTHDQYFTSGSLGGNTINAGNVKNHSTQLPLEVSVSYDVLGDDDQLLTFFGTVGYAYEFNNTGAEGRIAYGGLGNLGSVDIVSRQPGRHVLNLGLGAKYYYNQYEFGLSYDYTNRKKYNSHNIIGNFGIAF